MTAEADQTLTDPVVIEHRARRGRAPRMDLLAQRVRDSALWHLSAAIPALGIKAAQGDVKCAQFLASVSLATLRPTEPTTKLRKVKGATLTELGGQVLSQVAKGKITPGTASSLLIGIAAQNRVRVDDENRFNQSTESRQNDKPDYSSTDKP